MPISDGLPGVTRLISNCFAPSRDEKTLIFVTTYNISFLQIFVFRMMNDKGRYRQHRAPARGSAQMSHGDRDSHAPRKGTWDC
jgi:hypothetical protein